jgi:hypothetical protein
MDYQATEAERHFGVLQASITTFVMNSLQGAEQTIKQLVDEVKRLRTEVDRLTTKYEPKKVEKLNE